jgi:hypothetical protein
MISFAVAALVSGVSDMVMPFTIVGATSNKLLGLYLDGVILPLMIALPLLALYQSLESRGVFSVATIFVYVFILSFSHSLIPVVGVSFDTLS